MLRRPATLALLLAAAALAPRPAEAHEQPPAWPVRANVSMPFGTTLGREKMDGFTWGFRPALLAYPTSSGRGFGLGAFGEYLIDADTHAMWSLGGIATVPVLSFDIFQLRVGALAGARGSAEGNDGARRLLVGGLTELAVPAYLYDFRVGFRVDGTFGDGGARAASLLVEIDVVALLGLVLYGAAGG